MLAISLGVLTVFLGIILWVIGRIVTKLVTDEIFYHLKKQSVFQKICHTLVRIAALSYPEKDRSLFIESALPDIDERLSNNRSLAAIGKSLTTVVSTRYALYGLWFIGISVSTATIILMMWIPIMAGASIWFVICSSLLYALLLLHSNYHFYMQLLSKYSPVLCTLRSDKRWLWFSYAVLLIGPLINLDGFTLSPVDVAKLIFLTALIFTDIILILGKKLYGRVTSHTDDEVQLAAAYWKLDWGNNFSSWSSGYGPLIRTLRRRKN
jgi:hypothetical protein